MCIRDRHSFSHDKTLMSLAASLHKGQRSAVLRAAADKAEDLQGRDSAVPSKTQGNKFGVPQQGHRADFLHRRRRPRPVSYTHLTLPTEEDSGDIGGRPMSK
eukprot:TRINITY_DN30277_c0_g1_i1.p2 TRINITY_DN30277_c0_g1~~TRINITY_DN30277_c0_g1_i1.p2  ORF type:complete len:102 (+),score=11.78 TRINITY_DN30277_c0_g1_i1:68-373(+)